MTSKISSILIPLNSRMDLTIRHALFHIGVFVPLFMTVGFLRTGIPEWLYTILLITGISVLIYHGYKLMLRWAMHSNYAWVNTIHVAFVAPLLIYIGYYKKETPRFAYELLLMLGFAALGYHTYSMVKALNTVDTR